MKILFICTHNRCRSILAEAITNQLSATHGDNILLAKSAGSQPAEVVHPLAIRYLTERGYSIDGLTSQSWDDLEDYTPDVVITVCDNAARETCPVWFGNSVQVHWGLPDPSSMHGSDDEIKSAFMAVIDTLEKRIKKILRLNPRQLAQMNRTELKQHLESMAQEY